MVSVRPNCFMPVVRVATRTFKEEQRDVLFLAPSLSLKGRGDARVGEVQVSPVEFKRTHSIIERVACIFPSDVLCVLVKTVVFRLIACADQSRMRFCHSPVDCAWEEEK